MKLNTLVKISQFSWFVATALMAFTWLQIWSYAFSTIHYVIEDKFVYIGVLGGWMFVAGFYLAIILFGGYYIIGLIKRISDAVEVKDE